MSMTLPSSPGYSIEEQGIRQQKNKAFAYGFNTPKEDHRVAKALSGMIPKQASILPSLDPFDSTRCEHIYEVRDKPFSPNYTMVNPAFNVGTAVVDVSSAIIIYHYTSMAACYNVDWVMVRLFGDNLDRHLARQAIALQAKQAKTDRLPQDKAALDHHRALIKKLLDINSHLEARLSSVEEMYNKTLHGTSQAKHDQEKKGPAETTNDFQ
ncbi:LOW QUALITY PROTEIN: hypothetical protein PHMEG_00014956 [Phytophthora megakarya]|uniref:Uncharacterized protein n=1 Tax=Phytophthora megakarya TaxID=4795 RepID=A0A225W426_9STRA|nr:LOW QUALITY PROTEIN: hypothetical protein PHMEG_00014956 [Phytophthora megakarya]